MNNDINHCAHYSQGSWLTWLDTQKLIFFIYFMVVVFVNPLGDPDYFWHLAAGDYIATHFQLPPGDIFSFSREGAPWVMHEWLFEVFIHYVKLWGGDLGVRIATALLLTLTIAITCRTLDSKQRSSFLGLLITGLISIMVSKFLSPRPHLFGFLFFAIYLRVLFAYKYRQSQAHFYLLPILMVAWVNVHGGYIVALALLLAFTITESIMAKSAKAHAPLWKLLGWVLLASLINPDHVDRLIYPFVVFNLKASIAAIGEWQSPNFHLPFFKGFLVLFGILVILNVYTDKKPDLTEFLLPACFIFMTFVSKRYVPFSAIIMMFFIAQKFSTVSFLNQLGWTDSESKKEGKDLGNKEYIINWGILVVGLIAAVVAFPTYVEKHEKKYGSLVSSESC